MFSRSACYSLVNVPKAPRLAAALQVPLQASRQALTLPVGLSRLERLTSRLSGECSNQLSYRPVPPHAPLNPTIVTGNRLSLRQGARAPHLRS